ncbi:hypothetical protein ACOMHN_006206 [Nucella lapillus]
MCVQRLLRISWTQCVSAADPKDTINAACGEQFLRIPLPWDFTLWTYRKLLRIPSTQRVRAAAPKDTIDAAYVCSVSRVYHQRSVCVRVVSEDTINAACVCSGF